MTRSIFNATAGSGFKFATNNYTDGADSKHDEVMILGLPHAATYTISIFEISAATAASHIVQVMAGASLNVYIHEVRLWQAAAATTAAFGRWTIKRLTTAGTGGGAVTPTSLDGTDSAAGATAATLSTVKGTEGSVVDGASYYLTQTPGAAGAGLRPVYEWSSAGRLYKPIRITAGTTNGICIKNENAHAAAQVTGTIVITELAY